MTMTEYKYQDMIHRCFRCGYCKFPTDWSLVTNCPPYARFRMESQSAGGRLWLIRAWLNEELQWSENLANIVYSCTGCGNCVEKCPISFKDDLVNMITAGKSMMVEAGTIPAPVKDFLLNVQLRGNPYGKAAKTRADWTENLEVPPYTDQEFLFYVGCEGSFDSRAQSAAQAMAKLLIQSGVSFGILGVDEISDGNDVELLGEDGLFEDLAQRNIKQFTDLGVKKIITLSPHSFNAFKNRYPEFGGEFEVLHYTHLLQDLIQSGKLQLPAQLASKITFHDPCFLGRWNKEYESPRKVLKAVKGAEFTEMDRNKKGALCCGGGAGNFYTDLLGGSEDSPARIRAREAAEVNAEVLAVACPNCLTMLEDAVKVEGLEEQMKVKDIAEIICEAANL